MTPLQQSILATLVYFDSFDFPLTYPEIYRYLWRSPQTSLSETMTVAKQLPQLIEHGGFVMFQGRENLSVIRQQRYQESERKWNKRRRLLGWLTMLPGVRAMALVNTLAYHNVQCNSDVDILIVTAPDHIWSTRFYTTLLAKLLNVRPKPNHTKDAICLSFYVTPTGLTKLDQLRNNDGDLLEAYWLAQLLPIYDPQHLFKNLQYDWIKQVLPNTPAYQMYPNRTVGSSHLPDRLWLWERLLKKLQLWFMPKQLKQLSGPIESSVVVLSDDILKFHTYDPRPELQKRWEQTMKELIS
ncbi:MAG: hypothetical protein WCV88_02045 [Patescibacteria group bacterium]|jgi:hypothetical protein